MTPRTVVRLCEAGNAPGPDAPHRVDHFDRYRPPSGLDYHERADRQKHFELVDRAIVDRDTSGGPVDIAAVEDRLVSAMDSDPVALGHPGGMGAPQLALRHQ